MSHDHDAASVVAHLAGRGATPPAGAVTPERLIALYCDPVVASAWRSERRARSDWHAGFIGWIAGEYGYDDGYSYMGALIEGGWQALPQIGDWPYVIYLLWPAHTVDARWCIAHYCEGDFGVDVFDSRAACTAAFRALQREVPAP